MSAPMTPTHPLPLGTKGNGVCSLTYIFIALKRKITHLQQVAHIYLSPLSPLIFFFLRKAIIYDIFGIFLQSYNNFHKVTIFLVNARAFCNASPTLEINSGSWGIMGAFVLLIRPCNTMPSLE